MPRVFRVRTRILLEKMTVDGEFMGSRGGVLKANRKTNLLKFDNLRIPPLFVYVYDGRVN